MKFVFVLGLIFAASFAVRVLRLDFYSLWYDESTTAYLLQGESVGQAFDNILSTSGSETLHPLYYLLLSIWTQAAGSSEWALRFPSVTFGSLAVVVYNILLYRLIGRKALGFGAMLILSPFIMWYSREARPYSLIMFLTGLHLLFYLRLFVKPVRRAAWVGLIVSGALCIYSGILTSMLLVGEFLWSLLARRRSSEAVALLAAILLAFPIIGHGLQVHFNKSSENYYQLPKGMNAVRLVGIPQEFFVGRSFGPKPDEVRRMTLGQVADNRRVELGVEAAAAVSMLAAFLFSLRRLHKSAALREPDRASIRAICFITAACIVQIGLLILVTGYRMNARHLAFLFGPLFALCILPFAYNRSQTVKIMFILPLLIVWSASCANQITDPSYVTEDYRGAAKYIDEKAANTSQIVALCHHQALQYYGVSKPLVYLPESPDVTCASLVPHLAAKSGPTWLVLVRPWNYPNFLPGQMEEHFQVQEEKHLSGINMWLIMLRSQK